MKIRFLALLFALLSCSLLTIEAKEKTPAFWPKDFVQSFAEMPVQDGGRVKPMASYARFQLIGVHGRSKHLLGDTKLSAPEWMLDVLLRPEVARDYPTFQVNNADVLVSLGIPIHTMEGSGKVKKRDRYTYNELLPGRQKMAKLSEKYRKIKDQDRTVVQQQIVDLSSNVSDFEGLTLLFKFAQNGLNLDATNLMATEVDAEAKVPVSFLFENLNNVHGSTAPIQKASETIQFYIDAATMVALFPPQGDREESWVYPANVINTLLDRNTSPEIRSLNLNRLKLMEAFVANATDPTNRLQALEALKEDSVAGAKRLGTYQDITSEVTFYQWKGLLLGPALFILGSLMVAISWLSPRSRFGRIMRKATYGWLLIPTLLLVIGITWRCILKHRPPVTTLYETILFITAVALILLLVIEFIKRNGFALAIAPFLGAGGLFLAMRYELVDGQDTMEPLVAVLDTNYWLATHVTTVTMGYAAGLLAGIFAAVYILARLIDPMKRRFSRTFYREISGMTYGVVCFGLLFSLVGTILGGVWANDSWGRFWGWDPKENGALMIVLMNLIILHGRVGGYLREMGIALATVFGAIVVCYSWWGVNLLGAGLHSYGFTSGVQSVLNTTYASLWTLIIIGTFVSLYERIIKRLEASHPTSKSSIDRKTKQSPSVA
mgnify:CR=1 FL=1